MSVIEGPIEPSHTDYSGTHWFDEPPIEANDIDGDYLACPQCGTEVWHRPGGDDPEKGAYPEVYWCTECGYHHLNG